MRLDAVGTPGLDTCGLDRFIVGGKRVRLAALATLRLGRGGRGLLSCLPFLLQILLKRL